MSDETQTETTDEEKNFAALREQLEAANSRIAELSPLAVEKAVREAGFSPDTPEGKALSRLAGDTPDPESVRNLAVELGFETSTEARHEPTKEERAAQEFADRQTQLSQSTVSDEPSFNNADQIAAAEAAGDFGKAMALKLQAMTGADK